MKKRTYICRLCGKKEYRQPLKIKGRGNCVCRSCAENLPLSVRACAQNFSITALKRVQEVAKKGHLQAPWYHCEGLALADNRLELNGFVYEASELTFLNLSFHPTGFAEGGKATGYLTVKLATLHPKIEISETITAAPVAFPYLIQGNSIAYGWGPNLERIHQAFRLFGIRSNHDFINLRMQLEQEKRAEEERRRRENERRAKREGERQQKQNYTGQGAKTWQSGHEKGFAGYKLTMPSLADAKAFFGISGTFTMAELKRLRNRKITHDRIHPDVKGDPRKFRYCMACYNLLNELATDYHKP